METCRPRRDAVPEKISFDDSSGAVDMATGLYTCDFRRASLVDSNRIPEPPTGGEDTLGIVTSVRNHRVFSLIVVALFGHACSGGYGPQPTGKGGSPAAGAAG